MIYFDNAATTYPKPQEVYKANEIAMIKYGFNAGRGTYRLAKDTFQMIEDTRFAIAEMAHTSKNNVCFLSSATEALNTIIYGLNLSDLDTVYVSPFEHNSVIRALHLTKARVSILPFNKTDWSFDKGKASDMFAFHKPTVVLISQVSNVTGYMLPYQEIFSLAKNFQAVTVLDSSQSFGVYSVDNKNVDFLVFAGHKSLYASFGIAGFVNYRNAILRNYKAGGNGSDTMNPEMPNTKDFSHYEAGSPNACAIYTLHESLEFLKKNNVAKTEERLVKHFLELLKNIPEVKVFLPTNYISFGIVSFAIAGFSADDVGVILSDEFEICVRTGFHCSPYIHEFISSVEYGGTVRVSFGAFNTTEQVDTLVKAIEYIVSGG